MAGSIAVTYTKVGEGITRARVDWLSDAAGAVSVSTFDLPFCELLQVAYTPDGGGTQPTDLHDFTMTDPDGADALGGTGANLSNTTASKVTPVQSTYFRRLLPAGSYTPVGANCGNAKGGIIDLYVREL
ncbi:MAG: hypothetical protein IT360_15010 [Gemmatimonadaceae bacterium]|nr:hypothetical protein [Gemmatimonadaceae bacterium]